MPRITVDESLLAGPQLKMLAKRMGSSTREAIGALVEFWHAAQEYWGRGGQLLPESVFHEALELPSQILDPDLGFAETRDGGIYAKGSEERFDWIRKAKEAGRRGGLASAASRTKKNNRLSEPYVQATLELPSSTFQPSSSSSSSSSSSKEGEESPPAVKKSAAALPPLALIWNQHRGSLPEIKGMHPTRLKALQARWKEKPEAEYWAAVVQRMAKSDFCRGLNSDRGWKADFDFMLRPDKLTKILEGSYDNNRKSQRPQGPSSLVQKIREEMEGKKP